MLELFISLLKFFLIFQIFYPPLLDWIRGICFSLKVENCYFFRNKPKWVFLKLSCPKCMPISFFSQALFSGRRGACAWVNIVLQCFRCFFSYFFQKGISKYYWYIGKSVLYFFEFTTHLKSNVNEFSKVCFFFFRFKIFQNMQFIKVWDAESSYIFYKKTFQKFLEGFIIVVMAITENPNMVANI